MPMVRAILESAQSHRWTGAELVSLNESVRTGSAGSGASDLFAWPGLRLPGPSQSLVPTEPPPTRSGPSPGDTLGVASGCLIDAGGAADIMIVFSGAGPRVRANAQTEPTAMVDAASRIVRNTRTRLSDGLKTRSIAVVAVCK